MKDTERIAREALEDIKKRDCYDCGADAYATQALDKIYEIEHQEIYKLKLQLLKAETLIDQINVGQNWKLSCNYITNPDLNIEKTKEK